MKKTQKIFLCSMAGLSVTTPMAVLATSCSNKNQQQSHVHQDEEDIKYGIDEHTYKSLISEYRYKLSLALKEQGIVEGSEIWNEKMTNLTTALDSFKNIANTEDVTYGQLTTGIRNYAKKVDNLNLIRTTNATWSQLDSMLEGAIDSFNLYMDHLQFDTKTKAQVISTARSRFTAVKQQLDEEGYKNDPYGALLQAKKCMFRCFDSINTQIAKIAASSALSDFIKTYNVVYRNDNPDARLQNLLNDGKLQIDSDISSYINDIFTFVNPSGKVCAFDPKEMVPGYTITPVLKQVNVNTYSNDINLGIDWTAVSNAFVDTNKKESAVVHLFSDKYNKEMEDYINSQEFNEDTFVDDLFNKIPIKITKYSIADTSEKEAQTIKETYFQDDGIKFRWPSASCGLASLDPFIEYIGNTTGNIVDINKLASAGLEIYDRDDNEWKTLFQVIVDTRYKVRDLKIDEDPTNLTFAEKFIYYCDINAEVRDQTSSNEIRPSNEPHTILNSINISYRSSNNFDDADAKEVYTLSDAEQPGPCIDYVLSDGFYRQLCLGYSAAKRYNENQFVASKVKNTRDALIIFETFVATMDAIFIFFTGWIYFKIGLPTSVGKIFLAKKYLAAAAYLTVATAETTAALGILSNNWLAPVDNFYKRTKKLQSLPEAQPLLETIRDGSKWFVEFETVDKFECKVSNEEYEAKRDAWQQSMPVQEAVNYLKIFNHWTQRENDRVDQTIFVREFEEQAVKLKCSNEDWNKIAKKVSFKSPEFFTIVGLLIDGLMCGQQGIKMAISFMNDPVEIKAQQAAAAAIIDKNIKKYGLIDGIKCSLDVQKTNYLKSVNDLAETLFLDEKKLEKLSFMDKMKARMDFYKTNKAHLKYMEHVANFKKKWP